MNKRILEFSDALQSRFKRGSGINNTKALTRLAEEHHLQPGVDFTSFKSLYDIAEFSLNQLLIDVCGRNHQRIDLLDGLSELLPHETERSIDQSIYQQFSTPLGIGFTMASLLQLKKDSVVIDPSAGTGNLAECARLCEARHILVNELHEFRYQLLSQGNYQTCTREDGLQLNNLARFDDFKIDRVIMNPPFSRSVQTGKKVDSQAGANHLLAAYKRLNEGGRMAFAINGSFQGANRGWKYFVRSLGSHKVLVNTLLEDHAFRKKGTGFSTRLILIHKGWTTNSSMPQSQASLDELLHFSNLLNQ